MNAGPGLGSLLAAEPSPTCEAGFSTFSTTRRRMVIGPGRFAGLAAVSDADAETVEPGFGGIEDTLSWSLGPMNGE